MEMHELLKMNVNIGNLVKSPQVDLPPIIRDLVNKLVVENEAKIKELGYDQD